MKTYEELVQEYRKRQHDTVVDTISAGLTYVDRIAIDTGILEETGILTELTQSVTGILPFAIISATEGTKVLLGKKPGKTGLKDGAFRMVKGADRTESTGKNPAPGRTEQVYPTRNEGRRENK